MSSLPATGYDELIIIPLSIANNFFPIIVYIALVRCTNNIASRPNKSREKEKKLNHLIIHFTVYKRTTSGACFSWNLNIFMCAFWTFFFRVLLLLLSFSARSSCSLFSSRLSYRAEITVRLNWRRRSFACCVHFLSYCWLLRLIVCFSTLTQKVKDFHLRSDLKFSLQNGTKKISQYSLVRSSRRIRFVKTIENRQLDRH